MGTPGINVFFDGSIGWCWNRSWKVVSLVELEKVQNDEKEDEKEEDGHKSSSQSVHVVPAAVALIFIGLGV